MVNNRTHSIFCAVNIFGNIFWNITHRQAISPIAKFHHMLEHGLMIQQVIFLFN